MICFEFFVCVFKTNKVVVRVCVLEFSPICILVFVVFGGDGIEKETPEGEKCKKIPFYF
jgi:hypothetical protein